MIGNCGGLSTLYLALAERLSLPIYAVSSPGHYFVRYDDGKFKRNIETTWNGIEKTKEEYLKEAEEVWDLGHRTKEEIDYLGHFENQSKRNFLAGILRVRARCYYRQGDKQRARDDCQKSVKLLPDPVLAYYYIASQSSPPVSISDYDEVISYLDKAIKLSPDFFLFYYARANVYRMKGDLNNALLDCRKAVELGPDYALSYSIRGSIYQEMKQNARALADFDKAIKLSPEQSKHLFYLNKIRILYVEKEYDKCLNTIEKLIALKPAERKSYVIRGLVYEHTGKIAEAIRDFRIYMKLESDATRIELAKKLIKKLQKRLDEQKDKEEE